MRWFNLWIFLYIVVAGTNGIIVPDEIPTALSVIYSNIPKIKIGTDSRIGWGFRFGDRADAQILLELGPQQETQRLANQQPFDNPNYPELSSSLDEDYDIASDEPEEEDKSPKEETMEEREEAREEQKIEVEHKKQTEAAVITVEIQAMTNLLSKVKDTVNSIEGENHSKTAEKEYQIINNLVRTLQDKISEEKQKLKNLEEEDTSLPSTLQEKLNPILKENELKETISKLKKYIDRTSINVENETDFLTTVEIDTLKKLLQRLSTMQNTDHIKQQEVLEHENERNETDEENDFSLVSKVKTEMKGKSEQIDFNLTEPSSTRFIGSTHSTSDENFDELLMRNSSTANKDYSPKTKLEINNTEKIIVVEYPRESNITEQQLQKKKDNETSNIPDNLGNGMKSSGIKSEQFNDNSTKIFRDGSKTEEYTGENKEPRTTDDQLLPAGDKNSSMNITTNDEDNSGRKTSETNDNFNNTENEMLRNLGTSQLPKSRKDHNKTEIIKLEKIRDERKNSDNFNDTIKQEETYMDIQQGKNVEFIEKQHKNSKNSLEITNLSDIQNVKKSEKKNEIISSPDENNLNSIKDENEIDSLEKVKMIEILNITLINQLKHLTAKLDNKKQKSIEKILKVLEEEKASILIGKKESNNERHVITNKNGIITEGPYKGVRIEAYKKLSALWLQFNFTLSKSNDLMNETEWKPKTNTNSRISNESEVTDDKTDKSNNNSEYRIVTKISPKKYIEGNEKIFAENSSKVVAKISEGLNITNSPIVESEKHTIDTENYRKVSKGMENKLIERTAYEMKNINSKNNSIITNNKRENNLERNSRKPENINFDSIAKVDQEYKMTMIAMNNAQRLNNVTAKSISGYMSKPAMSTSKIMTLTKKNEKVLNQTEQMHLKQNKINTGLSNEAIDEEYRKTMMAMRKAHLQNHIIASSKHSVRPTNKFNKVLQNNGVLQSKSKMMSKNPILYPKYISTRQERNNLGKKSTGAALKLLGVKMMGYFSNILQNTKKMITASNKTKN